MGPLSALKSHVSLHSGRERLETLEHALQKSLQLKHLPKHQKLAKPTCPEPALVPIAHAMPTGNLKLMPLSALKSHVPLHSGRDSLETLEHALTSHVPPTSRERMETLEHALQKSLQLKHSENCSIVSREL